MAQEAGACADELRAEDVPENAEDPPLPDEAEPPPLPTDNSDMAAPEPTGSYVERTEAAAAEAAVAAAPTGKAENIHAGLSEEEQDALLKVLLSNRHPLGWLRMLSRSRFSLFWSSKTGTCCDQAADGSLCPAGVLL